MVSFHLVRVKLGRLLRRLRYNNKRINLLLDSEIFQSLTGSGVSIISITVFVLILSSELPRFWCSLKVFRSNKVSFSLVVPED